MTSPPPTLEPDRPDASDAFSPPSPRPARFSAEIERLIAVSHGRPVTLRETLEVVRNRGYTMLLLLLTFPFCTPIPLPGVSLPFGLAVAVVGLRFALGQRPWLPRRLLDTQLPPRFFSSLLTAARRLVNTLEYFLRPRFGWVLQWRLVHRTIGAMICGCGLLMMLPFPIPFSNGLPAFTVLLLAAALLEDDGYAAVAGGISFLVTLAFFAAIFWGGTEALQFLRETFGNWLAPDDQPLP